MTSYEKSNSITTLSNTTIKTDTKKLYHKLREQSVIGLRDLQDLSDGICLDMGIPVVPVLFKGKQPKKGKGTVKGRYSYSQGQIFSGHIQVYKYTAVREKQVAPKTAVAILLHEIGHHIDQTFLKLYKSLHTSGFYMRLQHLTQLLA